MPYLKHREILRCPSDSLNNGRRAVPFWFPRSCSCPYGAPPTNENGRSLQKAEATYFHSSAEEPRMSHAQPLRVRAAGPRHAEFFRTPASSPALEPRDGPFLAAYPIPNVALEPSACRITLFPIRPPCENPAGHRDHRRGPEPLPMAVQVGAQLAQVDVSDGQVALADAVEGEDGPAALAGSPLGEAD